MPPVADTGFVLAGGATPTVRVTTGSKTVGVTAGGLTTSAKTASLLSSLVFTLILIDPLNACCGVGAPLISPELVSKLRPEGSGVTTS